MRGEPKLPRDIKLETVERYLKGESSEHLAKLYGIHPSTVREWARKYQKNGIDAIGRQKTQRYSTEFKQQVVEEYLARGGSSFTLALKHGITAANAVSRWARQYNSHEDIVKSTPGGRIRMTRGRKTTFAERIEIVEYCINHDSNYAQTAEQYQISYGQVYTWVKKYLERGISALKDNRGKGKPLEDMNEVERLQAEIKLLQAQNQQLQMENDVLKKLEEIERRLSPVLRSRRQNI